MRMKVIGTLTMIKHIKKSFNFLVLMNLFILSGSFSLIEGRPSERTIKIKEQLNKLLCAIKTLGYDCSIVLKI